MSAAAADERLAALRFIKVPIAVLNDPRLSDTAVRVYGVLVDASRESVCRISVSRIGERLGRGRAKYAAIAAVDQLVAAGHVVAEKERGKCSTYLIQTGCLETTTPEAQPVAAGQPVNSNRLPGDHQTGCLETTLSRRNSRNVRTLSGKTENDETLRPLVALIERCGFNGHATKKARSLLRQFPARAEQQRLQGWLAHALEVSGINDPVAFAYSRTRDGDDPPRPQVTRYPPIDVDE